MNLVEIHQKIWVDPAEVAGLYQNGHRAVIMFKRSSNTLPLPVGTEAATILRILKGEITYG